MQNLVSLIFTGSLLLMAVLIVVAIFKYQSDINSKAQVARSLGFIAVDRPSQALKKKIFSLHCPAGWLTLGYQLKSVFHRALSDGDLYLFDLIDTSSDTPTYLQKQAVAICSDALRLPPFQIYPKAEAEVRSLGSLLSKIAQSGLIKSGKTVPFAQFPAFEARYQVLSDEPQATQRFFNETLARHFAGTQSYTLRAADDLLVFAEMEADFDVRDAENLSRRITRAMEIYQLLKA